MRKAAKSGDAKSQLHHDLGFHRALVEAAGNKSLMSAWLALGVEVPTAFGVFWTYFDRMELVAVPRADPGGGALGRRRRRRPAKPASMCAAQRTSSAGAAASRLAQS